MNSTVFYIQIAEDEGRLKFKKIFPCIALTVLFYGCATANTKKELPEIDKEFANELWAETLKITGNEPGLPIPKIRYDNSTDNGTTLAEVVDYHILDETDILYFLTADGVYKNGEKMKPKKVIIFYSRFIIKNLGSLRRERQYQLNRWRTEEIDRVYDLQIYLRYILAHEMLHPALEKKISTRSTNHREMLEGKYWESLVNFINKKYWVPDNNSLMKEMLESLRWQIEKEKKK